MGVGVGWVCGRRRAGDDGRLSAPAYSLNLLRRSSLLPDASSSLSFMCWRMRSSAVVGAAAWSCALAASAAACAWSWNDRLGVSVGGAAFACSMASGEDGFKSASCSASAFCALRSSGRETRRR